MRFSGNGWIKVENEKRGSGWNGERRRERDREKKKMREIGTYSVWRACCWSGLGAELQAAGMAASSNPRNLWFASRSRPPRSLLALSPRCTETWCLWQKKKNNIHHHHRPRWTIFCEHSFFLFIGTQTDEYENRRKIRKVSKLTLLWNATQTRIITSMYAYIRTMIRDSRRETRKRVTAFAAYEATRILISKYYITEGIILGYVNLHKEIYFFIGGAVNATKPNRATGVWRDKYPRSTFEGIVY